MKYEVIVPDRIQIELKKRLKSKEFIRRFYKKLRKLERETPRYTESH